MYLKAASGTAALAVTRQKNTFFAAEFRRLFARRGGARAWAAIEHTLIVATWHLLANGEVFKELGPNFYAQPNHSPSKLKAVQ